MVLCCLRGVFACVSRTWLPLEHSLLLSEPCWGNGCLHSTWPVVCIFAGCCWCNLCVNIFIYIYTPTPNVNISTQLLKKVVQERDDTNQNVDVLQSTPGIYVLNTLSLSLSTYDWVTGFGRRDDHYSILLFLATSLSFCQKSWDMRTSPQIRKKTSPICWSDPLPVLQTVWGFFQPHTASAGPL